MLVSELEFEYPDSLVAMEPQEPCRVMFLGGHLDSESPREMSFSSLLALPAPGDVVVVNNTRVLKRRLFGVNDQQEILFLKSFVNDLTNSVQWQVLFPSRKLKLEDEILLPEQVKMKLIKKGRPQVVELTPNVDESYFERHGEIPLPPYIQKARSQRHTQESDSHWYQTEYSKFPGSLAAPTAGLHFQKANLEFLKSRGIQVHEITLHVGLGTFLPVTASDLSDHSMHEEWVEISEETWNAIQLARSKGHKIWSVGTTVTRALESQALGLFEGLSSPAEKSKSSQSYLGPTKLLIQPPYDFKVVDVLLTNFHQPASTLLALVAAFAGLDKVKTSYQWAIKNKFRLFSYGDLSVWTRCKLK